jgi:hypothetical protein
MLVNKEGTVKLGYLNLLITKTIATFYSNFILNDQTNEVPISGAIM